MRIISDIVYAILYGLRVTQGQCSRRLFPDPRGRAGREHVSDPARGRRTTIIRPGVEGDRRLRRSPVDDVDHRFEQTQPTRWQADTRANHYAIVDVTG